MFLKIRQVYYDKNNTFREDVLGKDKLSLNKEILSEDQTKYVEIKVTQYVEIRECV